MAANVTADVTVCVKPCNGMLHLPPQDRLEANMNDAAREALWERIHGQDEYVARRKVAYDEVRRLGIERDELEEATIRNMNAILKVIRDARGDLTIEEAATAIGVSRQTVHRWLRISDELRTESEA